MIGYKEDSDDYKYFLNFVKSNGVDIDFPGSCLMSDRGTAIIKAF